MLTRQNANLKMGRIDDACNLYQLASNLATLKSENSNLISTVRTDAKLVCDESARIYSEHIKNFEKNKKVENERFCSWVVPITKLCASAGNIDECVRIRADGVSLREVSNRCNVFTGR